MATFYAQFWNDPDKWQNSLEASYALGDDFTFTTKLHGGFSTATFSFSDSHTVIDDLYYRILGFHVEIFDQRYNTVFEGYINELTKKDTTLSVNCLGYYSKATTIIDDRIYVTSPTTLQEVVDDAADLIDSWQRPVHDLWEADYNLMTTDPETGAVMPLDFTDINVNEAVERCLAYGHSVQYPEPAYLVLYEQRVPRIIKQFSIGNAESMGGYIEIFSYNLDSAAGTSMSLNDVRNRVYAVYANEGEGPSKTTAANDLVSQSKYGIIDGMVQNGGNQEGLAMAESLRDYALQVHAYPKSTISVVVSGILKNANGWFEQPWQVRAGRNVLFPDLDLVYSEYAGGLATFSLAKFSIFINSTSYSASNNAVTINVGLTESAFDVFMSRLGIQGGIK